MTQTLLLSVCGFLFSAGAARSQQAIRSSLAGEEAANSRADETAPAGTFFRAGPFSLSTDLSLEAEYNDNINLTDRAGSAPVVADFVLRPRLNLRSNLLLTSRNELAFDVGVGVDRYLGHPDRNSNTISLAPGSQVTFDLYTGDFRFTVYDRFSLQQNPVSQATLSNTSQYGIFRNDAGLTALWDLNRIILAAGYAHDNSISTVQSYEFSDYTQNSFFLSATLPLGTAVFVGARAIYSKTEYTSDLRSGANSLTLGAFFQGEITRYTKGSVFAGYRQYDFNSAFPFTLEARSSNETAKLVNEGTFFINVGLTNRLNSVVNHSLTVHHERRLGFSALLEDYTDVRYALQWILNSKIDVSTQLFYEHVSEIGSIQDEKLDRVGAIVSAGFQVTPRTAATLFYSWIWKNSNLSFQDYNQNVYGLELRYTF